MNQDIIELFGKFMDKKCSRAELEQVLTMLEDGSYPDELDYALTHDATKIVEAEETNEKWNEVSTMHIQHKLHNSIARLNEVSTRNNYQVILKIVSFSAAACLLLFIGWFFYNAGDSQSQQGKYENDVAPGKSGAILRSSNGKQYRLNGTKNGVVIKENQLSYNDGSSLGSVTKTPIAEMYSAYTAAGNTYMITLPDGTQVWLNAASQLDFPSSFTEDSRVVSLNGEAYFKVFKDKSHPFIVESKGQRVKVLGTQFNINSYADEKAIKTTLIEGSVQVNNAGKVAVLKPGQQSSIGTDKTIMVSEADTTFATAWKNNKFIFENSDIESVMRMIQRWYNVEVVYTGSLPDASFGGKVSRYTNVSQVLHVLEVTGGAHFRVKGRTIYVSK